MTNKIKSPFYVVPNFLSPLLCEDIVDELDFLVPDVDSKTNKKIKAIKHNNKLQNAIFDRFQHLVPTLEEYYGFDYKGTERFGFEWFPEGTGEPLHSESCDYIRKKWVKTKNRDFSCLIFLSNWQDTTPFDNEYEVYGGKIEFPNHDFGFNPERGALIIYPSGPHFMNATAPVVFGDLFQIKFHLVAKSPYLYEPQNFPGDYTSWFKHL